MLRTITDACERGDTLSLTYNGTTKTLDPIRLVGTSKFIAFDHEADRTGVFLVSGCQNVERVEVAA